MKTEEDMQADYFDLESKILEQYPNLSKRLRQIAHFVLDNPSDIAIKTAAAIADDAEVQPSALIRFAQTFDFAGFSELQQIYKTKLLTNNVTSSTQAFNADSKSGALPKESILQDVIHSNVQALARLQETIAVSDIETAATILTKAAITYVIGLRKSFPAACYLTNTIAQSGKPVHLLDGVGGLLEQQSVAMTKKDALVVVSFAPYAPEVLMVIEACCSRGVPIVAISDSKLSPVASHATVSLLSPESDIGGLDSITASLTLSQTLVVAMSHAKNV